MGFRIPTVLNCIAVLVLISGVSTAVRPTSAERCQTAPGTDTQRKELCSLGCVVQNIVHHINTCLNQPRTWMVSNTNPMIIIPQTNNGTQGVKETFTWRQFDIAPPATRETRNVCRIRCIPRRARADKVKNAKQIKQKRGDSDSIHLPTQRNSEGKGEESNPIIQEGKETTNEGSAEHEHPEEEKLCIPEELLVLEKECKSSDSSNQETHEDEVKKCASDAIRKASCGKVKGLCPSMTVLNCLVGMQAESEHFKTITNNKSNIDALDNSKYHDDSIKIRIESLGHDYELKKDKLDQLKDFSGWYDIQSQELSREKPMVVHVEDTSLNKTSKYVVVKEIGNMLVGMPYSELPTTSTTPRPTTTKPLPPPRYIYTPYTRKSFACVPSPPQALTGRLFFPHGLGPLPIVPREPFVGYARPQDTSEQPYHRDEYLGMTNISPPNGRNFQMTTELPTLVNQFKKNQAYTDRPLVYNRECGSNECADHTGSWSTEEILPEHQDCDNYQDYDALESAATTNAGYNVRHEPQSYWNAKGNLQSTTNTQKSLTHTYEKTHRFNHNQFQMNSNHCDAKRFQPLSMLNSNKNPYSRPMPQMGNSKQTITNRTPQWPSFQRKPERLLPAEMPDYLTNPPQKYIAPTGDSHLNAPKIYENDVMRGILRKNNQPTNYDNPMKWVKTDLLPSGRHVCHQGQTPWGQNFQTHNNGACGGLAPLQPLSSGSYSDSYDHGVYPRTMIGYTNPIYNPLEPPVGYTLPPRMKVC